MMPMFFQYTPHLLYCIVLCSKEDAAYRCVSILLVNKEEMRGRRYTKLYPGLEYEVLGSDEFSIAEGSNVHVDMC